VPSGFQRIGSIVIIKLKDPKHEKKIAQFILDNYPGVKTVCRYADKVKGELREPTVEYVLGDKNTEVMHKENDCIYKLDVTKVMFSKGNLKERGRVAELVQRGETVIDMFAGIGYFSIPIAKRHPSVLIYAIEKNPNAIEYLYTNKALNKAKNMKIVEGDCRHQLQLEKRADRIIMGYLPKTYQFLPAAFNMLKREGIIHYHDTYSKGELWDKPIKVLEDAAEKAGYKLKEVLYKGKVKEFAPNVFHIIIDARFSSI